MNQTQFRSYKKVFVDGARQILAADRSDALAEAAFPAYANTNPLISYLFWQRIRKVMTCLEERSGYASVMDFGCGSGVMLPFLSRIANEVVGVDIDLGPLKKMESHVRFPENVRTYDVRRKSLQDFAPSSFEAIIALDVLEHVDDLSGILSDLRRLLAPGGRLVVSGPTENLAYRLGRKIAGEEYSGHYHVRNISDIRDVMTEHTKVSTVATLFHPVPLFKIYCGTVSR